MRMEIFLEKKPLKQFKLLQLTENELNMNLDQVTQWSPDYQKIYQNISQNGFADFICNKEYIIETYTNIVFDSEDIKLMDNQLLQFKNLQLLRLNHNKIETVQHLPQYLIELNLFNNTIPTLNLLKHNLQYLGQGYCLLNDDSIQTISKILPQLISLDLALNQLCDLEYSVEACKKISNLKILSLYGNPLVLMSEHWFPLDNKQELVQAKMEMIQKEKDEELEEKKAQQAFMIKKKNKVKGKGKILKKDDKKNVKKGEDEPVQKVVGQLDWEIIYICK